MSERPFPAALVLVTLAVFSFTACQPGDDAAPAATPEAEALDAAAFDRAWARVAARADSVDRLLAPLPLLTGAEESRLRSFPNAVQVARAKALGRRVVDSAAVAGLAAEEHLVLLEDTTEHWVIRELEHSLPYVTPDARALLEELGERFQARLEELDLPPYRLEVTSVLRTPQTQADLRTTNQNAAAGVSSHEYGTTLDVAYNAYAPPARTGEEEQPADGPAWLSERFGPLHDAFLEMVAARRSRELQAVLGQVLLELQEEGKVMVMLERQQPVFHMTVAQALAG